MPKYIILIVTLFSSIVSFGQVDKEYDCIKKGNLTLQQRLEFYPFSIAKNIMLVSFSEGSDGLPFKNNKVIVSKMSETQILDSGQIDSLTYLLYNIGVKGNVFKFVPAACYFPRNAILFLD